MTVPQYPKPIFRPRWSLLLTGALFWGVIIYVLYRVFAA